MLPNVAEEITFQKQVIS